MSDTLAKQVLDAVIAALNTDTPAGIPEAEYERSDIISSDDLPTIVVFPGEENVEPAGNVHTPAGELLVGRRFQFAVEARAKGTRTTAAAVLAEPMRAWIVQAIGGNTFGKLVETTAERGTRWRRAQADFPHTLASVIFEVTFPTLANDMTVRPGRPG